MLSRGRFQHAGWPADSPGRPRGSEIVGEGAGERQHCMDRCLRSWAETLALIGITEEGHTTDPGEPPPAIIDFLGNISRLGAAWSKHTLIKTGQSGRHRSWDPPQR